MVSVERTLDSTPREPFALPSLLVSVRSPQEAQAAVASGADIIDVKEPSRGSLGRAEPSVWQAVRAVVPHDIPVSVALGELNDWLGQDQTTICETAWTGIDFCKLGLSGHPPAGSIAGPDLRRALGQCAIAFPNWVAVIYLDWQAAQAPHPDSIIAAALEMPECRVVLFDTFCKSTGSSLDSSWRPRFRRIQDSGARSRWPARSIAPRSTDGKLAGPTFLRSGEQPVPAATVSQRSTRSGWLAWPRPCARAQGRFKCQTSRPEPAEARGRN